MWGSNSQPQPRSRVAYSTNWTGQTSWFGLPFIIHIWFINFKEMMTQKNTSYLTLNWTLWKEPHFQNCLPELFLESISGLHVYDLLLTYRIIVTMTHWVYSFPKIFGQYQYNSKKKESKYSLPQSGRLVNQASKFLSLQPLFIYTHSLCIVWISRAM